MLSTSPRGDPLYNRSTRTTSSRTRSRSAGCVSPEWGASSASQGSRSTSVSRITLFFKFLDGLSLTPSLFVFIRPSVGLSRSPFVRSSVRPSSATSSSVLSPPRPYCGLRKQKQPSSRSITTSAKTCKHSNSFLANCGRGFSFLSLKKDGPDLTFAPWRCFLPSFPPAAARSEWPL